MHFKPRFKFQIRRRKGICAPTFHSSDSESEAKLFESQARGTIVSCAFSAFVLLRLVGTSDLRETQGVNKWFDFMEEKIPMSFFFPLMVSHKQKTNCKDVYLDALSPRTNISRLSLWMRMRGREQQLQNIALTGHFLPHVKCEQISPLNNLPALGLLPWVGFGLKDPWGLPQPYDSICVPLLYPSFISN